MIFVTRYSFITAILLSNLFFLFFIGLSRSNRVLLRIPLRVFALLGAALLVKLLFPIEVESTIEISSFQIYPAIIAFLGKKLFTIGGFVVQVRWLLLAVWMTGTVCIAWSRIRFYRQLVRRFGHLPSICDESYLKILEEVKRENGYAFETTVIVDKNIRTILEFGYFRQIIFLPKAAYTEGELRYIFLHELEHFANKTNWMKLIVMVLECIFWWNPLVYLLKKDLSFCLELRCDKRVTKALDDYERCNYGQVLVTELKKCYEEENSDKQNECNLKSALIGMNFASIEKNKKNIHRMEMILYPNKKQTIKNTFITAFAILLSIGIFFASYCVLIVPGWDTTYEDCVADLVSSGEYNDNVEVYDETNMYVYVEKDKTTHLIFEPYDKKKGVVYTKDDSIIIPYSDIENGYYNYCLILREK